MTATNKDGFIKSSFSSGSNDCVELKSEADGVLLRDSKNPNGPVHKFSKSEMAAFIQGAKAGEFDKLVD